MNIDWDAKSYSEHFSFVPQYGRDLIELLDGKKLKILDLGCGGGNLTKEICDRGHEVTGIDLSQNQIEFAKKCYPEIKFFVSDALALDFDQEFDAVISNAVLHWIDERNQPLAAKNVLNCLKKAGSSSLKWAAQETTRSFTANLKDNLPSAVLNMKWHSFFPLSDSTLPFSKASGSK